MNDFSHIIYEENNNNENIDINDEPNEHNNNENIDIYDEPDDSSLRDIYTGQTFTTFEVLETCLK